VGELGSLLVRHTGEAATVMATDVVFDGRMLYRTNQLRHAQVSKMNMSIVLV
jgi:hypothetical protein